MILEGHTAPVRGLAFPPDCSLLASASDDGTVRVWHLASGEAPLTLRHNAEVNWVAIVPGADLLAASTPFGLFLRDPETGEQRGSLTPERGCALFAFPPDGKTLAAESASRSLALYDVASGQVRLRLLGPQLPVCAVAFSPDGKELAAGSCDCSVRVWDLQTAGSHNAIRIWRVRELIGRTATAGCECLEREVKSARASRPQIR